MKVCAAPGESPRRRRRRGRCTKGPSPRPARSPGLPESWMSKNGCLKGNGAEGGEVAVGVDGLDGGEDRAAPRAVMLVEPHQEDQHDALPQRSGFSGFSSGCGVEDSEY